MVTTFLHFFLECLTKITIHKHSFNTFTVYNVCHATGKVILDCSSPDLRGCTLYTLYFPCNKCALTIIQSGMTKFVYYNDDICPCYEGFHTKEERKGDEQREKERASKKLLDHARCSTSKFVEEQALF